MEENKIKTIDEYIAQFDDEKQEILKTLREIVHKEAPGVKESMSWGMPTFILNGNLVHFAVNKKHIGFYPGADGIEQFKERFGIYKFSKGTVQFPFDKKMPYDLIKEIVCFRVKQNTSHK